MPQDHELFSTSPADPDTTGAWERMLSATHLPWSVAPPARGFRATARRAWIDDLALVDCTCSPCSGRRSRRQIAGTDGEFVVVLMTLAGRETVGQDATERCLRPGDAVTWDSTRPATFTVWERLVKRSLVIPRAALEEVGGRSLSRGAAVLDGSRPATRLLVSYLGTLADTVAELDRGAVRAARNATLELVAGALRSDTGLPGTDAVRPALRARMDRWIDRHLTAGVSPQEIAAAHGVSVRTVHRVYSADGRSVGEVVRVRRLARARTELADTDRPVSAIAHRWGFSDTSHFSRSFKAAYGTSPSAWRERARDTQVQGPVATVQGPGDAGDETGATAAPGPHRPRGGHHGPS
ncbi:helix-turn-helix domain-containing protein [Pseudonocardia sp. ICBG162]|uniref:helix-turn-helix domain-containing protein n=1 Tax=Pseudonocardia sp. ICBG162 TaxID=2846761 RepID=UPI001CF6063B|nr:helix-turn-helix domain-containing protein [Pseudonocardia sp. ICBG162]